ncbi:multi-sensor signal transduction histidine kinase [Granulicella tundricola MP5ACTX9]|uniref:histidine kinase n=1 Tax=Granulicella tundricola (strain ATCC BAA-1859 / DSM 23138 / MP5ACTX9) TaxID=1198114 RepID=E8X1I9_GRATM|nr:multi-sensor signal transduction histidine kinase [Granulicella tundricola MP5ACTX9]
MIKSTREVDRQDDVSTTGQQDLSGNASVDETTVSTVACEDEPIRIPGSIQRHGFLLLLDEGAKLVVGASENVEEMLGVPWKLILGTPVETILEREVLAALRAPGLDEEQLGTVTYLGSFPVRHELYSVVTHRTGTRRALEFERIDRLVRPELMNVVITNFVGQLSKLKTEDELCRAITKQVLDLTGVNRVMLYSFNEAGHGTVMAEESDGTLPSYLGLRFPDGDIPQQARDLYLLNTVRIIPDSSYIPSPLHVLSSEAGTPVDLSMALLRSVSPIHLQYMQNMGTAASMSISIVCEGKLWGLISCHHASPRVVPYLVRSACDLLTKLVGTLLTGLRTTDRLVKMVHFHAVQRRILTQMAAENDYVAAMQAQMTSMVEVTDASGVALIVDGVCELAGDTPAMGDVLRLAEWMNREPEMELYSSRELGLAVEWAEAIQGVASGMLAIRISTVKQSYVIWFRPELVRAVSWAGEPLKIEQEERGLEPRTSFKAWKVLVRGQSEPWSDMEIESAREFRAAVMTISLKRAEEAAELSESRFKQLTHALPNLVWTTNDDGLLNYVNERWRDQGLGDEGRWFDQGRVFEEDRERCMELWAVAVREGTAFEAEVRLLCGTDRVERWNLVRAAPFVRANGMRAGWVGTCTDLTDRHERELALKLTEKLALTGRMTSVIAHEINNPLEAITNLLYLLRDEVDGDGPAKSYIAMAESELQRISGITKQTLRWSRDGTQKAEHGTAAMLFDDVLRLLAGKIRNREVTLTVSGGGTPLFGVISQLQQVLANLVSNAVDAVPVGGRVWISAKASGSGMEVEVGDTGLGMTEEMLRKIFQPFYSTKGDLGNGLGLYISQEIVERHGGQLTVVSEVGVGTRVRVGLPERT